MCLAQGPQRSDAGEARTRNPSVSCYHAAFQLWILIDGFIKSQLIWIYSVFKRINLGSAGQRLIIAWMIAPNFHNLEQLKLIT